jgi:hypothetical protein
MTAAARRFRLEIAGQVLVGLAFASDAELEAWLSARGALVVDGRASRSSARAQGQGASPRREAPAASPRGPGRTAIDDGDALAEVHALIAKGPDSAAALRTVAATLGGDVESSAHRLRRKLRALGHNAGRK